MAPEKTTTPRVLFVTPEVHPIMKTGGLGEVSHSLPPALRALGADVRLLLPGYPAVLAAVNRAQRVAKIEGLPGFPAFALLAATLHEGVPAYVIECAPLYQRGGGPYVDATGHDWPDNAQRFGLLSRLGALLATGRSPLSWQPQIAHCNDWQAGLAPAYLHFAHGRRAKSVMTIHNLAYQGVFPLAAAAQLGLPAESHGIEGVEYYGNFSFLKAGLHYADRITTVSPTYAREIQHEPLGFGLQGLLAKRHAVLSGILNGIDTQAWNPAHDRLIPACYSAEDLSGKAANKRALQQALGLAEAPDIPLFGVVSRLAHQKGLDLVLETAARLLELPAQLACLGSGEPGMQQALAQLARDHPGRVAVYIGFDEARAHLIEAGADIFLMPSRFEPCGLNQMYSQRYGTPPVVHATGGLADSVVDATAAALADGSATGFHFHAMSADGLLAAVQRAVALYREPAAWRRLQQAGMARDFGWEPAARRYLGLYRSLA